MFESISNYLTSGSSRRRMVHMCAMMLYNNYVIGFEKTTLIMQTRKKYFSTLNKRSNYVLLFALCFRSIALSTMYNHEKLKWNLGVKIPTSVFAYNSMLGCNFTLYPVSGPQILSPLLKIRRGKRSER